jgi:hypothetical protein
MATRTELALVIGQLNESSAYFGRYVKMLESRRDDTMAKILLESTPEAQIPSLRGEARAYDTLLHEIATAIKDKQK